MAVERFVDIKVERGRKAFEFLHVCMMADGSPLGIPVHIVAGAKPGPKLVVMSTAHGYEICQISVIKELVETIDPRKLKGTLVAIPVANPVAFEGGTRSTWIDSIFGDSGNMNRLWPGRPNGWLTERMTYKISSEVFPGSDCVIDLHAATENAALALAYGYLGKSSQEEIEISKVFGQEILIDTQPEEIVEKMQWGTSKEYLRKQGIPSYSCEIGEFHGLWCERGKKPPEQLIRTVPEVGVTGVTNVMKYLGMLDGEPRLPDRQIIVQPELNLRPAHGGLLVSEKTIDDLGTIVPKGGLLGTVISPYTFSELDRITAPFEESLLLAAVVGKPFRRIHAGDYGYIVADMSKSRWIENT
jgi:predicted deacylase